MDGKKIALSGLKEDIPLAKFTSFNIGGRAKYFFEGNNKREIIKAVSLAKQENLPFFILGGGSNLLVDDKGYHGLVIKIQNSGLKIKKENSSFKVIAEAGIFLSLLVLRAAENSLSGLEWAVGIPATLGGAIYGNAGAFGKSMKDIVKEVEVFDAKDLKVKIYSLEDCRFDYRESIFKKDKNLIILSAVLELEKGEKKEIEGKMKKYLSKRKKKQPIGFASAGSVFKNPSFAQTSGRFMTDRKLSAGELIERCGLKGRSIGGAKISEKHANFIINLGKARFSDVRRLIDLVKKRVRSKFGIELEEELQYLEPSF
ncbi:MAG TPA: UDP-N-acetylmuramate dehydrogenase [bacterium]|nr:UDP-N-acetylmuramate dehydrogenase [bacterium]